MRAIRYIVRGRVQGVGFRDYARRAARQAGVTGWVRNLADGSVEAMAVGSEAALAEFAAALARGPRWAQVDEVAAEALGDREPPDGFEIRH